MDLQLCLQVTLTYSEMGKKRKTQNQKEKRATKRRDKEQWEATPILEKAGMVSFKSAGIETTTIGNTNPSLNIQCLKIDPFCWTEFTKSVPYIDRPEIPIYFNFR